MIRIATFAAIIWGLSITGSAAAQAPPSDRPGTAIESLEALTGVNASEPDEIETDRDSFTPATTTSPRGRLIAETAYTFADNRGFKETHSFPELVLRYGLSDRVELRLGWNYEVGGEATDVTGAEGGSDALAAGPRLLREYTLQYGVKLRVTDQDRWTPRTAIIVTGFTPTGGNSGTTTATQIAVAGVAGWELPNRWRFDTAFRYGTASDGGDRFNVWAPSAVLRVPFREKWALHAEYFGTVTTGKVEYSATHYFSPGVHYLVTPDLEVGVRLGWGLNDQSARFFANTGVGYRF